MAKKIRKTNNPGNHRHRRRRRRRRRFHPTPAGIAILVIFAIAFAILIQQAVITSLDRDVSRLQRQVEAQQSLNDSKEGKIISAQNLNEIEKKARAYGMKEPGEKQYQYVVVRSNNASVSPLSTFKTRIKAFVSRIRQQIQKQNGKSHAKTSEK